MKRWLVLVLVLCFTGVVSILVILPKLSTPTPRAMWLWNWDNNDEVLSFADASQTRVTDIFVYAKPGFSKNPEKLTDLVTKGQAQGINMIAMAGDPAWVTGPGQQDAINWVNEVKNSKIGFTGLHLELEPHLNAAYETQKALVMDQYVQLLTKIKVSANPLPVELSVPWWYYQIGTINSNVAQDAINQVDSVTIVTFATSYDEINKEAQIEAEYAVTKHKPFRFASETNNVQPPNITFYGSTNSHMLQVQDEVNASWQEKPNFTGFAIEEYQGWKALPT